jgi:GMP synthase (glutamine-hydrolysing)
MTGSPLSITQPCAWMKPAGEYLREAADRGIPVLGVCFGQQLLAHVYGAKVAKNPNGREIGTVEISLTDEGRGDPLFTGFGARFAANATHEDAVLTLPEGWVRLAGNANTPLQAIGYRDHVRAVQFHPELLSDGMRELVLARSPGLEREAREKGHPGSRTAELLAGIRPTPLAPRLLTNFVRYFC